MFNKNASQALRIHANQCSSYRTCVEFNVNVQQWNKNFLELKQYSQKSNQKLLCSFLRAENR